MASTRLAHLRVRTRHHHRRRPAIEACEIRLAPAGGATFQPGDLLVAVSGQVQWRRPDGTLADTIATPNGLNTGMAFDAAGNLYVSRFTTDRILRYSPSGQFLDEFGTDGKNGNPFRMQAPESIVFDAQGSALVGTSGGNGALDVLRLDPSGLLLARYDVPTEASGSDWLALAPDQKTLYYTSEGTKVLRYDLATRTALPAFAADLPGPRADALQLLPDGGLIVANAEAVLRLDASGAIVKTYDQPGADHWFAVNLDPDGTSFWSADEQGGLVARFDVASGDLISSFEAGTRVLGLVVAGQRTAATSADLAVQTIEAPSSATVGATLTYRFQLTNEGPGPAANVQLTDLLPAGLVPLSATSSAGVDGIIEGGQARFAFATLDPGASVTVTVQARAAVAGTWTQTVRAAATTQDFDASDNQATATTRVNRRPSDVALGIRPPASNPTAGQAFNIVYSTSNLGPGNARNVVLTVSIPTGVSFVAASAGDYNAATRRLTVKLGSMTVNRTSDVLVRLRASSAGSYTLTGSLALEGTDPVPANNTAQRRITVVAPPPRVASITRAGNTPASTRVLVRFDQPMDPASAASLAGYRLAPVPTRGRAAPSTIRIRAIQYDPATRTAIIQPSIGLGLRSTYQLRVDGPRASDTGLALDGDGDGLPGGVHSATLRGA